MQNKDINKQSRVILGYYAFRGKIQVTRLLCEYLGIQYTDVLFTPKTWEEFKSTQKLTWSPELPFLKDNEIVVTEVYPIITYILYKANREDMMGRTPQDKAKVDMLLWESEIQSQLLYFLVSRKENHAEEFKKYFEIEVMSKLKDLDDYSQEDYFLGYISIYDFFIYETLYFMKSLLVGNVFVDLTTLPKLFNIFKKVAEIPQIKAYESSTKALKIASPTQFCEEWKMRCRVPK